ncbi:DUF6427 family protein [Mariniphaga anaerophila]|nr:DUF6427 family protein [Mariniphaga anaerophila]
MGILFWLKSLISPEAYPFYRGEQDNILYAPIHNLLKDYLLLQIIVTLFLVVGMALVLLQMNNKYNIIRIRTMLPAPLFVLIVSGFMSIHALHPVYFAALFVLLAVYRLFSAFDQLKPYSPAFDSGFFLGIASLFYFNAFVLLPAFLVGVGILSRETKWRELAVCLLGFTLPFVFAFSYAFVSDQVPEFLGVLESNIVTPVSTLWTNIPLMIYLGLLLVLIFFGTVKILQQYDTKKVSTRRFFVVLFLVFACILASFILVPATSVEIFVLAAIPVTFLLTNFFVFLKRRFWGELWFFLLVAAVVALEFLA